jgi:HEAT repeat protein
MEITDGQIAALIADLDHPDKPTIRAAVDTLIPLANKSLALRNILDERLTERGHKNYWPVAYVLGHLNEPSPACIAGLIDALDHSQPDIRWAMALLLVRIANEKNAVVESLVELCAKGTGNQKRMALYCVRDLALSDPVSLAALLTALGDGDPTVRVAAAICLKPRPDIANSGRQLLLKIYVTDPDPRVRHAAAITLANLGTPSAEFLSALTKSAESDDRQTKKAALAAFELIKKTRSASSDRRSGR